MFSIIQTQPNHQKFVHNLVTAASGGGAPGAFNPAASNMGGAPGAFNPAASNMGGYGGAPPPQAGPPPSQNKFVEYISGGCELNVMVAIDFTGRYVTKDNIFELCTGLCMLE